MSTFEERDIRLQEAMHVVARTPEGEARDRMIDVMRVYAGTASDLYRSGNSRWSRLWNWLVDSEYVAIGPPPIAWFGIAVAGVGWVGFVLLFGGAL